MDSPSFTDRPGRKTRRRFFCCTSEQLEAETQDPDNSALTAGSHCRWRPFLPRHRPDEIAARVREFMDMPKESVQGEEIMATATTARPPFPPFTRASAMQKVRLAEDAWNTRDPAKVALA